MRGLAAVKNLGPGLLREKDFTPSIPNNDALIVYPYSMVLVWHILSWASKSVNSFIVEDDLPEGERLILVPVSLVELVLELDPMQSEGVQETLHGVHAEDDAEGDPDHHPAPHEQLSNRTHTANTSTNCMGKPKKRPAVWLKNTFESCEWASESAHSRRYDAVFEIAPSTNSMVSISWCTIISEVSSPSYENWGTGDLGILSLPSSLPWS
jgi:hypothetical protein